MFRFYRKHREEDPDARGQGVSGRKECSGAEYNERLVCGGATKSQTKSQSLCDAWSITGRRGGQSQDA